MPRAAIKLVHASLDDLQDRVVAKGEGWQRAREAFSMLLGELSHASMLSAGYVSGEYTCRDHRADTARRPPMKPIEIAKQREAIRLLQDEILSAKAFQFKPELLRQLAPRALVRAILVLLRAVSVSAAAARAFHPAARGIAASRRRRTCARCKIMPCRRSRARKRCRSPRSSTP